MVVEDRQNASKNWQVYMILCSDNSLYTGITTDIERRFVQHARGQGPSIFAAVRRKAWFISKRVMTGLRPVAGRL